jgi:hypothetical protein
VHVPLSDHDSPCRYGFVRLAISFRDPKPDYEAEGRAVYNCRSLFVDYARR